MLSGSGTASAIISFLPLREKLQLQQLNRRAYSSVIPQLFYSFPVNNHYLLLERDRRCFYLCPFNQLAGSQKYAKLFEIAQETNPSERTYTPNYLGFKEVYF